MRARYHCGMQVFIRSWEVTKNIAKWSDRISFARQCQDLQKDTNNEFKEALSKEGPVYDLLLNPMLAL